MTLDQIYESGQQTYTPKALEEMTGVPEAVIREAGRQKAFQVSRANYAHACYEVSGASFVLWVREAGIECPKLADSNAAQQANAKRKAK